MFAIEALCAGQSGDAAAHLAFRLRTVRCGGRWATVRRDWSWLASGKQEEAEAEQDEAHSWSFGKLGVAENDWATPAA